MYVMYGSERERVYVLESSFVWFVFSCLLIWVFMCLLLHCAGFTYSGSPFVYRSGVAISSLSPNVFVLGPSSYAASNLPAGLTINPTTGVISGTPSASGAAVATVTVTGTYASGTPSTVTFSVSMTVEGEFECEES